MDAASGSKFRWPARNASAEEILRWALAEFGDKIAISTSFHAVRRNPRPMILWAALIVGFVVIGILTMCVGLVFVFPLAGHATWHAFKDLVDLGEGSARS